MEKLTGKENLVLLKVKEYLLSWEKMTIRALQTALGYASPRSISVLLDQIISKWWVYRDSLDQIRISPQYTTDSYEVRDIPLIGAIACGMPIFAEENIETKIPISTKLLKSSDEYFFLRADGDSMNQKWIESGDLILIRKSNTPEIITFGMANIIMPWRWPDQIISPNRSAGVKPNRGAKTRSGAAKRWFRSCAT